MNPSQTLFSEPEPEVPAPAPDPNAPVVLVGEVVHVIYSSGESGFRVLRVRLETLPDGTGGGPAVVAGRCSAIRVGERIRAVGRWRQSKHGTQLEAESVAPLDAVTDDGLARSLDGLVAGLGIGRARRLVSDLGGAEQTIALLDRASASEIVEHAVASPITRIGAQTWMPYKVRLDLVLAWTKSRVEREVDARLASLDLPPGLRARLVARYGADAARVTLEEPYRLPAEVDGVGFITADDVALKVGVGVDSLERVDAATLHVLREHAEDGGHTVSCVADLKKSLFSLFMERRPPAPLVEDDRCVERAVERLLEKEIVALGPDSSLFPDDAIPEGVSVPALAEAEASIARDLRRLLSADRAPLEFAGALDPDLTDEQRLAVRSVFERGVCVITGGPGTGKSRVCGEIVRVAESFGLRVALCAPTARAAKRLSEMSAGATATTIHRLLEAQGTGRFQRDATNPISAELILMDEGSMTEVSLMAAILSAVDSRSRLLLCGDADQLPPVGPGAPFRDVIASGEVPVARLTKIHRQATGSAIVRVAHGVLRGATPSPSPEGDRTSGCVHLVHQPIQEEAVKLVVRIVLGLREELGVDPWEAMVISPMRKGACGVTALNNALQRAMNPPRDDLPEIPYGKEDARRIYRLGDRVRQTKNDYDRGVVNGDLGRIVEVYPEKTRPRGGPWLDVNFPGVGIVHYDGSHLVHLVLAYCNTVHSSQGGEAPAVVLALVDQHYVMLTRTLLYTAVTRAKRACIIVGSRRALETAARNARDDARRTTLPSLLSRKGPTP